MAEPKQYKNTRGVFYEIRAYVGTDEITGRQTTVHKMGFRTKKAAREWAAKQIENVNHSGVTNNKKATFQACYEQWLEVYKTQVRPTSYQNAMTLMRIHVLPIIGQQMARRVSAFVIQSVVDQLSHKYSRELYSRCYHLIMAVLRLAHERGVIDNVPVTGSVRLPKETPKPGDAPENFWTPAELASFRAKLVADDKLKSHTRWVTIINLLADTGMRCGELVELTWQDVDYISGSIRVNKTASRGDKQLYITQAPKTEAGRRSIPIDARTQGMLKRWRVVQSQLMLADGVNTNQPGQLLFPTQKNTLTSPCVIGTRFKALQDRYGIEHVITAHGLRHTFASALAASGASIKTQMEILGHKNASTTIQTYTHVTVDQLENSAFDAVAYLRNAE